MDNCISTNWQYCPRPSDTVLLVLHKWICTKQWQDPTQNANSKLEQLWPLALLITPGVSAAGGIHSLQLPHSTTAPTAVWELWGRHRGIVLILEFPAPFAQDLRMDINLPAPGISPWVHSTHTPRSCACICAHRGTSRVAQPERTPCMGCAMQLSQLSLKFYFTVSICCPNPSHLSCFTTRPKVLRIIQNKISKIHVPHLRINLLSGGCDLLALYGGPWAMLGAQPCRCLLKFVLEIFSPVNINRRFSVFLPRSYNKQ